METVRCELIPGVWLTALRSDKFKTGCLSINLLTQLNRETAALNAVLPFVLRRGTRYHPDMETIAAELDSLYGTGIEPIVRKIGEIQCIGFYASFPDEKYLPQDSDVFEKRRTSPASCCLRRVPVAGCLFRRMSRARRKSFLTSSAVG